MYVYYAKFLLIHIITSYAERAHHRRENARASFFILGARSRSIVRFCVIIKFEKQQHMKRENCKLDLFFFLSCVVVAVVVPMYIER
jgi:hypothetical protein